jgi:hypothetical protein
LSSRERRKGITPSAAYLSESSVSRKLTIISYGEQILEVLDSGIFGELIRRIEHLAHSRRPTAASSNRRSAVHRTLTKTKS